MVRDFTACDHKQIESWYVERSLPVPSLERLPPNGFIVDGVACGFLILTDNKMGLAEFFISNPETSAAERKLALHQICGAIIKRAKEKKCYSIKCDSKLGTMKSMAMSLGFQYIGDYSTYYREF